MAKIKFNASMFDKIKDSLQKKNDSSGGGNSFANILKLEADKNTGSSTYVVRLIPNFEEVNGELVDKTFYHFYIHQWQSLATNKFTSILSLQTFNEVDPIANYRWKLYASGKDGNQKDAELAKKIDRKEQWYVNVYVIEDPNNASNNGTVKVLKVGPQLKKIIDAAVMGDRADEFGMSVFDLGKDGCDLKIKATIQGEYTTYQDSFFTSKTSLRLSDDEIDGITDSLHDLTQIQPVKNFDEVKEHLNEHFLAPLGLSDAAEQKQQVSARPAAARQAQPVDLPDFDEDDVNDDIPMLHDSDKKEEAEEINFDDLMAELDN